MNDELMFVSRNSSLNRKDQPFTLIMNSKNQLKMASEEPKKTKRKKIVVTDP